MVVRNVRIVRECVLNDMMKYRGRNVFRLMTDRHKDYDKKDISE